MLAGVEQAFGVRLPLSAFFEAPTVAEMAARLGDRVAAAGSRILSLRSGGAQVPLVLLHPGPYFRPLMLGMPDTQPILGLTVFDASGITLPCVLEHLAARQVEALRRHQPEGPYLLAGWCADGVLAYEMARQMTSQGASVPLVIMIDSFNPGRLRGMGRWKAASIRAGAQVNRARFHLANALRLTPSAAAAQIRQTWRSSREERTPSIAEQTLLSAVQQYDPRPYSGTVLLFRPQDRPRSAHRDAAHGWRDLIKDLEVVDVPGDHHQMLADPNVRTLVAALATRLSKVAPRISHDESLSAVAVRYAQSEP
jgi:thioesterase domain-containing protein